MTIELRRLLENAQGTTEHIIAIILDIRGFTPFCKEEESLNVANFLKRVYIRIIDEYFPKASFYKPTGDGLLIIIPYTPESLKDAVNNTMINCLNLLENFGKLREGDDMINFTTPDKIGIGISRGAACRISSEGTIIDYSGRVINLASRLNDFARPSGIVLDSKLNLGLLPKKMQDLFLPENVYVRGIAEDKPITIYFTKKDTVIPLSRKQPLKEPQFSSKKVSDKYETLMKAISSGYDVYEITLEDKPLDERQIHIDVIVDVGENHYVRFGYDVGEKGVCYEEHGAKRYVCIDYPILMRYVKEAKTREGTRVNFEVSYPVAERNA